MFLTFLWESSTSLYPFRSAASHGVKARCLQWLQAKALLHWNNISSFHGISLVALSYPRRSDRVECKSQSRARVDHAEMVASEMRKGWAGAQFTRAGINRTFPFNRQQLVARLTDALIVYPVLGRHRPDLRPVCWGRFSPPVDRIEGMKYLLGVKGNSLLRGEGEGAAVQHSCISGCNKTKFPVEIAMSNCLRGICVFGGRTGAATVPEQWQRGEN